MHGGHDPRRREQGEQECAHEPFAGRESRQPQHGQKQVNQPDQREIQCQRTHGTHVVGPPCGRGRKHGAKCRAERIGQEIAQRGITLRREDLRCFDQATQHEARGKRAQCMGTLALRPRELVHEAERQEQHDVQHGIAQTEHLRQAVHRHRQELKRRQRDDGNVQRQVRKHDARQSRACRVLWVQSAGLVQMGIPQRAPRVRNRCGWMKITILNVPHCIYRHRPARRCLR